ncbi:MAG: hypothetical protein JWN30_1123, partial [Bacilli bacterium]|nr:hypothetical protein [Bacilli bacterium]
AVLSRFGGDEFAILCAYVTCEEQVTLFAERIISQFIRALTVGEREFYITPSIGVAMYPYAGTVSETLLKHADGAMYVAKANGGNRTEFYRQADENMLEERLDLETDLKKALERNEFSVHYQPKFRLDTGEIQGVEALLRWNHPERGIISPAQFIPIAEESGVIVQLGEWVLREACRQNREWQAKGYKPLVMCVNVSPKQFQVCNMVEVIANVLTETHMDAVWLGIEITEGLLVHNSMEIASVLKKIRTMGVLVAIDDFGTGYSSLAYLQKFEPTHLKIDQSFVSVMFSDAGSKSIVNAVIDLAHNLGMQVVAEGVESEEQLLYLKEHGCDMAQGFLYSKPINCAEFERNFLRQTSQSH